MTPAEACQRLGIAANSPPAVIRAAYDRRQQQGGSGFDLAVLAELEEIRNALSLGSQGISPQHSPDDPIEQILGLIALHYIPREGQSSEEQLRAVLLPFFPRSAREGRHLSPEDVNWLDQQLLPEADRPALPAGGRILETEADHLGLSALLGEAGYHFLVWLPWLLIPATLITLGTSWLVGTESLWDRWLATVGLTTALLLAGCLLFAGRRRFSPPRWRLLDGPNGLVVEFPHLGARVPSGAFRIRTSWLGRLCGLEWVALEQGNAPFLVDGLSRASVGQLSGEPAGDPSRSLQEGFSLAVTVSGIVLVLLRTFSPVVHQALSPDDRVLLLLLLAAVAYLAVGRLMGWLVGGTSSA